jgi:hypothetical protein
VSIARAGVDLWAAAVATANAVLFCAVVAAFGGCGSFWWLCPATGAACLALIQLGNSSIASVPGCGDDTFYTLRRDAVWGCGCQGGVQPASESVSRDLLALLSGGASQVLVIRVRGKAGYCNPPLQAPLAVGWHLQAPAGTPAGTPGICRHPAGICHEHPCQHLPQRPRCRHLPIPAAAPAGTPSTCIAL